MPPAGTSVRLRTKLNALHTFPIRQRLTSKERRAGVAYASSMQRDKPGPGQESVWDYPRPPRLEPVPERITVELGGKVSSLRDQISIQVYVLYI